jgi:hypothetical protein
MSIPLELIFAISCEDELKSPLLTEIWARGTCTARIYDYSQAIGPATIKEKARKG